MSLPRLLAPVLLIFGVVAGLPQRSDFDPEGHDFIPAGPDDTTCDLTLLKGSSPCPWLNALANHGYLPRDGRYVTRELVENGFSETFNFEPGTLEGPTAAALTIGTRGDGTFDLNDTVKHNVIEHDGSVSRNDLAIGDALAFNPTIWNRTVSHFRSDTISAEDIAAARLDRFNTAQSLNLASNLTDDMLLATFINHAVWQISLGDRIEGNANTQFTRVVFEEERLPFNEGFVKPDTPIVGADIVNMVDKLQKAAIQVGFATIPDLYKREARVQAIGAIHIQVA